VNPSEPLASSNRRPNIVLIICDDLAFGDLSHHGNPHIQTPHVDRIAREGVEIGRYLSGPVCTPARTSLMTGRYPYRTKAIDTYLGRSMMDPDEITLAEVLRDSGYRTAISGKWHLGDCYPMRPMDKGFERSFVHRGGGLCQPGNVGRDDYFDADCWKDGQRVRSEGYCTDAFTDQAMAYMEQMREDPFFLYVGYNAPHSPLRVEDRWADPFREQGLNETFARLYGMVANIDDNVGRIQSKLEELELDRETILIFTSDHGPCNSVRHEGQTRFNAGLRSTKGTNYEGGLRVPFFVRWPGGLEATGRRDVRANPIDVLPTLAEACDAVLPEDRAIDGESLWPVWRGEPPSERLRSRLLFSQWHRGDEPQAFRHAAVIGERYKLLCDNEGFKLYDVEADPGEQTDLAADRPDVVRDLKRRYTAWFEDVSNTRPDNYAPPRIVIGAEAQPLTHLTRQDWRVDSQSTWADRDRGWWLLCAQRAGRYRIEVRPRDPIGKGEGQAQAQAQAQDQDQAQAQDEGGRQGRAFLSIDGQTRSMPLDETGASAVLDDVTLAAGELRLEAWLTDDRGRVAPYRVDVQRLGPARRGAGR